MKNAEDRSKSRSLHNMLLLHCNCSLLLFGHEVVSESFATPWTAARQAPLSIGILQARTLEWVAISSSVGCSQPRDCTLISYASCIGRWVLAPLAPTLVNRQNWSPVNNTKVMVAFEGCSRDCLGKGTKGFCWMMETLCLIGMCVHEC